MRARRIVTISLLLILCGLHETSRAQSRSLFGSSGPTTQATLGGSRSSFYSSQSGGFGTAQPFGTQGFGSGFGSTGLGTGMGGAGTGMGFGGTQFGSSLGAGPGFVGLNNTAQGFVGMQQTGQTGGRGFGQQFGGGHFGSQFGGRGRTGNTQFQQFNQSNNQRGATNQIQLPVRPQIAFEYPQPPPAVIATSLDAQIGRIADRGPAFRGIRFAVEGTVVTLTGFVPDENTKRVAAALVRLEPGVRDVQNELVVAPPPSPVR